MNFRFFGRGGFMFGMSRNLVAASALAVLANGASAQDLQGFYVGGGIGGFYQVTDEGGIGNTKFSQDWDIGTVGILSLGYGFGNGLGCTGKGTAVGIRNRHLIGSGFQCR